jgi:hypothetical protein
MRPMRRPAYLIRTLRCLAAVLALSTQAAQAAPPSERVAGFLALQAADLKLATIGYRLATGNVGLCQLKQAQFGMPLQAITQYDRDQRADARTAFGFSAVVVVEAVVPDSPAAQAGLRAGDSLLTIDGVPMPTLADARTTTDVRDRELAQAALNRGGLSRPRVLRVLRDGVTREVSIAPRPGCRLVPELLVGTGLAAQSDGVHLQIGDGYLDRYDIGTVAIVVAHEMAHNMLHHYDQLRRARSCLVEAEQVRRTEEEADRLSVALLANGGYDPSLPARFWKGRSGVFQFLTMDRDHGSASDRLKSVTAATATMRRSPSGVFYPADFQQMFESTKRPGCASRRPGKNTAARDALAL